jgi:hypothetical protein
MGESDIFPGGSDQAGVETPDFACRIFLTPGDLMPILSIIAIDGPAALRQINPGF